MLTATTQHAAETFNPVNLPPEQGQKGQIPGSPQFFNENDYIPEDELVDIAADLTDDDKKYLAMK